jgi:hypothetical protein
LGSQFIEVGIGLVFVYLLMAVMVSAINEIYMSLRAKRGRFLSQALETALNDPQNKNWAKIMYDHPLIDILKRSEKRPPAYISSKTFAKTLVEVISNEARADSYEVKGDIITYNDKTKKYTGIEKFVTGLSTLNESHTKNLLQSFVNNAGDNLEQLKVQIESWFNEYMDRVGGWYKRKARVAIFVISLLLTICMNVDTIRLSKELWKNGTLRETVADNAQAYVEEHKSDYEQKREVEAHADRIYIEKILNDTTLTEATRAAKVDSVVQQSVSEETISQRLKNVRTAYNDLNMLQLPIGWGEYAQQVKVFKGDLVKHKKEIDGNMQTWALTKWILRWKARVHYACRVVHLYSSEVDLLCILGWLFTAAAVSLGAPYWFDLLSKLINVRSAGKAAPKPNPNAEPATT